MDVRVLLGALLIGLAAGARITSRNPYWMSDGGGTTLTISGEGFSEDQFSQFDPTLGNKVVLMNEEDSIDCEVVRYLTNREKIVCSPGKKTNLYADDVYAIKVFVDGEEASGYLTVQYARWYAPLVETVTPVWSLPGALVRFFGWVRTDRYKVMDVSDPLEDDPNSGTVLTKVFVGNVDCEMINATSGELYGVLEDRGLTCLVTSKNIGPMNGTMYVQERGASVVGKWGVYVDSQDKLYQHHTYAGVDSVSPATGSPGGSTVITVTGVGFNSLPGSTEVKVGGADCKIQEIADNSITCLTPAEDQTSAGSRERGLQWEFWHGQYPDLANEAQWSALTSSHPDYSTQIVLDAEFDISMTSNSAGKLSGYLHAPHDGEYALAIYAQRAWTRIYVATNGNPDNLTFVNHWELFNMTQETPIYLEIRYRGEVSTLFKVYMNDFNAKYTYDQCRMASNERHRLKLNPKVRYESQRLTPSGSPSAASLYLNGMVSDPVDITDAVQVRAAVLGLAEQKCETIGMNPNFFQASGFEDGDTNPDNMRGDIVDDIEPYCGRRSFKLHEDPRLYEQGDISQMVDLHIYPYICFAISGNVESEMRINFYWWDKWNRWRADDISFPHNITVTKETWKYQCINIKTVALNSWINTQRNPGSVLKARRAYAPKRASEFDTVHIDMFAYSDENVNVQRTRPSALDSQGILITDVNVNSVTENSITSLDVEFITSNCYGDFPLLGVTNGAGNPSWLTTLDSSATFATFSITGGDVNVSRIVKATHPVQGTWSMDIQGASISGISPSVEDYELQEMIEGALGVDGMYVSRSGNCEDMSWYIEWTTDPGRKILTTVDDSQLIFDGESVKFTPSRNREGKTFHDPIVADFLTVRRTNPSVSVRVNGYSAACLDDCSYAFDSTNAPSLASVSGQVEIDGSHTLTINGTDMSSSDISDYTVIVGSEKCTVSSVTSSLIICSVPALTAGSHPISVIMQPFGAALQPDPVVAYLVTPTITSINPSTGGTGGGYSIIIYGSGFPSDISGWAGSSAYVNGFDCEITDADDTSVTCTVPAGSAGVVDVAVSISSVMATLSSSFTYDSTLSASITSVLPMVSSVLGGDELNITGTDFGTGSEGFVMVGSSACEIVTWASAAITCTLPSNSPGVHVVKVYTGSNGYASGSVSVTYKFKVTGSSLTTGSVYGGTTLVIDGEGFGSNCSLLEVEIGDSMICDITECNDMQLTCTTRLVSRNHVVTNMGSAKNYGPGYAWTPKVLTIQEGDSVTWSWMKKDIYSQLVYNVFQTASASDKTYDGTGFNSGAPTMAEKIEVIPGNQSTYRTHHSTETALCAISYIFNYLDNDNCGILIDTLE
ncbi:hypothetical protein SK128_002604 [Halocaridina rubra]|uniref:IPT/TIG domain-containing protein n=1 Tax=Halocaridina rubra TaxID=373956 RepID=A0AAN9AF47_HALRR